ncbi:type III secretion system translocon subunit SctE [Thalassomonas actiniarum]|uniref:Type III secretion system translocon subunit SctE n=1 Tax=Thalassomonas actiniarum TaxID=485447 RepID=A0AAE9YLK5_9GAMM|nr:type III secretion system translocon subunit SctE [Thalassomonas actiniarum]WDD96599.1 type III secretion system translocon subunit SctE [Thalassomonas actiniarum]
MSDVTVNKPTTPQNNTNMGNINVNNSNADNTNISPGSALGQQIVTILTDGQGTAQSDAEAIANAVKLAAPQLGDMSMNDLMLMLTSLNQEVTEEQAVNAKENIKNNQLTTQQHHDERIKKIEDALKAIEKAKESSGIGKVFGWIASAAMIVAGAALIATGVGAVAGTLMIAAGAVMLTSQISGETGDWMNEGLAEVFMAIDPDMSKEDAMMAAQITVLATVMVLSLASGGAAMMGPAATGTLAIMAAKVAAISGVVGGAATVGQGGAGLATTAYTKEAADARADAAEQQMFINELMMKLGDYQDKLEEIMQQYAQGIKIAMETLTASTELSSTIMNNTAV